MIKYFKLQFYYFTSERFPNLFRPSSKPFISGDTFRLMADHIFDESKSFDPKNVNKGDVIFLMSEFCEIFFKTHHPYIQKKYILITHNSFKNISKEVEIYIDEKIIHWYVLNLELKNSDKYSLIPYGLENLRNFKYGRKKWFIKNDKLGIEFPAEENAGLGFNKNRLTKLIKFLSDKMMKNYFNELTSFKY